MSLHMDAYREAEIPNYAGFHTTLKESEEVHGFLTVKTSDPIKLKFWEILFESFDDMKIKGDLVSMGIPIEMNDSDNDTDDDGNYIGYDEYSIYRIIKFFEGIHVDEVENVFFEPNNETEKIVYESIMLSVKAYKKALMKINIDYEFLSMDIHYEQFILSREDRRLICIDPINITI